MMDDTSSNWLELYRNAVLERNRKKLRLRVAEAHKAVQKRLRELWYAGSPQTSERRQLDAALNFLGILRAIGEERTGS